MVSGIKVKTELLDIIQIGESALSWFQGEDNVSYFVEALFDSEVATSDRVAYDGYHVSISISLGSGRKDVY